MKKCIVFIIASMIFAITPCYGQAQPPAGNDSRAKLSVVTTIFSPYDFMREVAGDNADITMLLPPGSESHSYEPTPQDIIKIQNCDIFIYTGGNSEAWVDRILSSMNTISMNVIKLVDCVEAVEEDIVEGMENDQDNDHEEEDVEYDEHVWTSPKNAKIIIQKILDTLCEIDAVNANAYKANATAYIEKLDALDAAFKEVVNSAVRKTIVFGDRFPFRYFVDAYGLDYFAAFPGCSTETEPSARTVAFLINKIKKEAIPVVFHIELSNEKMARTISEETGAKVLLLHSCHNITRDDFQSGKGYLDLMKQNVTALKEALK